MTGEYTFVALDRQQELTRAIQERLANAHAPHIGGPGTSMRQREHLARARPAKQKRRQSNVIEITHKETAA